MQSGIKRSLESVGSPSSVVQRPRPKLKVMQARALPGPRNAMPLWLAHNSSTSIINNL